MGKRQPGRRRFTWFLRGLLLLGLVIAVGRALAPFPYAGLIRQQAALRGVDPFLVAAVVRVESSYRPAVVSRRGAVGLMQLMPATARWIRSETGNTVASSTDLTDPAVNIKLGTWYLAYLMSTNHDNEILALAAYNSGPAVLKRWLRLGVLTPHARTFSAVPYPETRNFIARVLFFRQVYRWMYGPHRL